MNRENLRCHWAALTFCLATVGPMTIWITDRGIPFEIYSGEISPNPARPGDVMEISWDGYRIKSCPGEVRRKVIDAWGAPHEIRGSAAEYSRTNNPKPVNVNFRLPMVLPPGRTTYIATSYFSCNWTQRQWWFDIDTRIKVERPPVKFEVIANNPRQGPQGIPGPPGPPGPRGP